MFTQQTLSNLATAMRLVHRAKEAHKMAAKAAPVVGAIVERGEALSRKTGHPMAPSVVAAAALGVSADQMLYSAKSTLSEGVMAAQPLFVGTPFHEEFNKVCSYFDFGAANVVDQATAMLTELMFEAAHWLNEQEEAVLPLQQFVVPNFFRAGGDLVMARSPAHARLVAAAAQYGCSVEELDLGNLYSWNNGVLGTEPQEFDPECVGGWQPAWLTD